jgi:peptidoglycan/xylan/chitin deacetylase (PgdA/CDA1 family)
MRMKHCIKKVLFRVLYYSGIERLLTSLLQVDAAMIVMYHGVSDQHKIPREIDFHASHDVFERQIRMLSRRYEIIGMSELLRRLADGSRLDKQVVLTFDDGYRNNLTAAAPILRRYSAPFSVYLATAPIGSRHFLPLNELYALHATGKLTREETTALRSKLRTLPAAEAAGIVEGLAASNSAADREGLAESFAMLSWDEVRELSLVPGAEIGAHTDSHCNLAAEPPDKRRRELTTCREAIARELGTPPRLFAYPFGGPGFISQETRQSVMEAGFACAITTLPGVVRRDSDPYSLPRIDFCRTPWMLAGELLYRFVRAALRRR